MTTTEEPKTPEIPPNAENTAQIQPSKVIGRPFPKGISGNPAGRPKGSRNFTTLFEEAIKKVATSQNKEADEVERDMIQNGIVRAIKGDLGFFKDLLDRVYGKAPQSIDITSKGEQIGNGLSAEEQAKLDKILNL